jgi:DnaJ-domain-containing protein 1
MSTRAKKAVTLLALTIGFICLDAAAFHLNRPEHILRSRSLVAPTRRVKLHSVTQDSTDSEATSTKSKRKEEEVSRFLTDFKTAKGNLVDPYKVLKIPRTATSAEIKQSYRKLSRKWHPDAVARKEILPGNW